MGHFVEAMEDDNISKGEKNLSRWIFNLCTFCTMPVKVGGHFMKAMEDLLHFDVKNKVANINKV